MLTRSLRRPWLRWWTTVLLGLAAWLSSPAPVAAHTGLAPLELQPPMTADFSDAEFAAADQPELGDRTGASSRSDDLWFFLFFYYLFFIFLAPFDYSPHHHGGGCAPSHHGGGGSHHPGGGHGH